MTIRVHQFTPERLLEAPRRSAAYPSPDGKFALYTCSTYSFKTHTKCNEICLLDIQSGQSSVLSKDAGVSEPKWIGKGYDVLWLESDENGRTTFIVTNAQAPDEFYEAGTVPAPVSSLKLLSIGAGDVAIAVVGQANPDGNLYNAKDAPKTYTTAKIYDSLFVRHWDTYVNKQRNSIFTGVLHLAPASSLTSNQGRRYKLSGLRNALRGTGLECPIPTFGGAEHFDIGPKGLVIVAKDPDLDPAVHTKCNTYFLPKPDSESLGLPKPRKISLDGFNGAATSPVFSPDGNSLVFLQMKEDGYEADQHHIVLVKDVDSVSDAQALKAQQVMISRSGVEWDRSPNALTWSHNGKTLYVKAEDRGIGALFAIALSDNTSTNLRKLTDTGFVSEVVPASKNSSLLLLSSNSLVESSIYTILDPTFSQPAKVISSLSNSGGAFGLNPNQVSSHWWDGDQSRIHAWVIVPSWFNKEHRYPLALLIHGGPQGAWNDSWSTRWNPAIFAEQGYVVVCPNITGSTGYGQALTDAINCNWGGSPYVDIEKLFASLGSEFSWIDTSRTVALGASYGGYMMNWIQGKPLAKKLKALVCHDGVFSMSGGQLSTDELYFPTHEMRGQIWDRQAEYDKWDPSRYLKNWNTPMLVIHNELDYRLPISEGLAAFNTLQMRGIQSRFLTFSDENHWVLKHENSLVWHLVVLNWINESVGLPKIVDRNGSDGSEYVRRGKVGREAS